MPNWGVEIQILSRSLFTKIPEKYSKISKLGGSVNAAVQAVAQTVDEAVQQLSRVTNHDRDMVDRDKDKYLENFTNLLEDSFNNK